MSLAVSITIGSIYGLYYNGILGSKHLKHCLANQIDYHPFIYKNQAEAMNFLQIKGSEDIS